MRTPQMQLAKKLGISKYANPAGGCLLTDPCFSKRLEELLWHEELSLDNLVLLRVGRHFRIEKKSRLVVGRNENENRLLAQLAMPGDYLFFPQNDLAAHFFGERSNDSGAYLFIFANNLCVFRYHWFKKHGSILSEYP